MWPLQSNALPTELKPDSIILKKIINYILEFYTSENEFVYLFRNADFILTNSFHGLAFSINFNKQFLAISPKTYNTRLLSILTLFDLTDRLIINNDDLINDANINYDLVNKKLSKYRNDSIDFLRKSIKGDKWYDMWKKRLLWMFCMLQCMS